MADTSVAFRSLGELKARYRTRSSAPNTGATVGARLRKVIEFRALKVSGFAAAASIPYRTLQDYLFDKRKPGADYLVKLADVGVDLTWLLTGRYRGLLAGSSQIEAPAVAAFGDTVFLGALIGRVFGLLDKFHVRYHAETKEPLRWIAIEAVLGVYLGSCSQTIVERNDVIHDLAATGVGNEALVDVVTMPLRPRDFDERLYEAIAELRLEEPPTQSP